MLGSSFLCGMVSAWCRDVVGIVGIAYLAGVVGMAGMVGKARAQRGQWLQLHARQHPNL